MCIWPHPACPSLVFILLLGCRAHRDIAPSPSGPAACYELGLRSDHGAQGSMVIELKAGRDSGLPRVMSPDPMLGAWHQLGRDTVSVGFGTPTRLMYLRYGHS